MSAADNQPPIPSAAELEQVSVPAVVRRTPRLARVIVTGALGGLLLGVVLGILLPGAGTAYRATVVILTSLAFSFLGALVAGAIASRPTSTANPGRVGLVIGIAAGALLVMFTWSGSYSRQWALVSIVVMVGIPFFSWLIGKSFSVTEPPSRGDDKAAFEETMKAWAARQGDDAAAPAKQPAASKPAAKKPAASKPAAKKAPGASSRTTKGK